MRHPDVFPEPQPSMSESHGSTQEWQLAEELFLRALELDPAERGAFVTQLPVAESVRRAILTRLAGHDTSHMLSSLKPGLLRGDAGSGLPRSDAPWMALPADAPYRVGDAIGRDAVAARFHARRVLDGSPVVMEFLSADLPADPGSQDMVRQTAAQLRAVAHPHIGIPADCGDTDEGQLYLVRDGSDAETLARRLRRMPPLTAEERAHLLTAIRGAVAAAHAVGIVHGQIRPEWMVLTTDGGIRLYGFGVEAIANTTPLTPALDQQALDRFAALLNG